MACEIHSWTGHGDCPKCAEEKFHFKGELEKVPAKRPNAFTELLEAGKEIFGLAPGVAAELKGEVKTELPKEVSLTFRGAPWRPLDAVESAQAGDMVGRYKLVSEEPFQAGMTRK